FIGKTPDGEHRIIIGSASEEGATNKEVVGVGKDVELALHDSLEKMRTLETVRTRSLAHIEMTDSSFASFTTLEHYNPKVAPSRETYPVPDYLEATITDSGNGNHTYRNTVEKEGWQTEIRTVLADYLQNDSGGQQLVESLKIRSLSHLTPEQAVKLSAAFVQNVSRYTQEDVGQKDLSRADQSTTAELLREGIANRKDPNWKGNGVCRNVASNVKAVFESLKATQTDLSMLNNTYAVYGAGADGAGYADSRVDQFSTSFAERSGHAWNTFVTVDKEGSAVSTIIDATWALGKDAGSAIEHLDRTEVRAVGQLMQLFEKSEVKTEAFVGLTDYVQRLIRNTSVNRQLSESGREGIRENVTTEYLKAAAQLPEMPEDFNLPEAIVSSAYRSRGKLEHEEVATLFALDKASGGFEQERIKGVIAGYDSKRKVPIPGWKSAENLVFADDDLQALAYEAVGEQRVNQLSEQSGAFRARQREVRPETLPAFDASERPADAQELSHFASQNGIHDKDPKTIMRQFNNRLKKLVGDDAVYDAIVAGRNDYDLAKNFSGIVKALRN
ncbi:MAG: hypothetical protein LC687_02735, partial [Actinobacteria bacterium]|nr:hypothetical protein [Actinomycetota bacterium]